jgi:hypothetical protein
MSDGRQFYLCLERFTSLSEGNILHLMKRLIASSLLFFGMIMIGPGMTSNFIETAEAAVRVNGYFRKNGTYVQPHYRSNPDGNPYNNWSFPGNTNPYTGETATGNADTYLRNYYNKSTTPSYIPSFDYPSYSLPASQNTERAISIPANAYASDYSFQGWFCNSGYKKVSNECQKIIVPLNAYSNDYSLDGWSCNSGYKRVGSQCEKITVPTNAYLSDYSFRGWFCNSGYKQVGDGCQKVIVPTNAYLSDYSLQGWFCNSGYKKMGNECQKVIIPTNAYPSDYSLQGWFCLSGYRQMGNECLSY